LAFAKQALLVQMGAAAGHGTAKPHSPTDLQVCSPVAVQRLAFGVHAVPLAPPDAAPPEAAPPDAGLTDDAPPDGALPTAPPWPVLPPDPMPALPPLLLPPLVVPPWAELTGRPPEPSCPPV